MASRLFLFCFFLFPVISAYEDDYIVSAPSLDAQEQDAVYNVLQGINPQVDWRSTYPDDLCNSGPHGIVCEPDLYANKAHVVELNLGWVADSSNNPPCSSSNASFSPSLSHLSSLRKLFIYHCFAQQDHAHHPVSLPPYLWSLGSQLEELVLQDNPGLTGTLPPALANLVRLRRLIISGTRIGGTIPTGIKALHRLQQLDLSNNNFNNTIPSSSLGELKQLVVLDLSRNSLIGTIPTDVGSLTKLSMLDLSSNNLTGAIPASFASLHDLEMLDLGYNRISGGIPLFLGGLPNLKNFHLGGNPIGGFLPDIWNGLKGLISLDLSSAGLVGKIPFSMGDLKNLSYMALDHNSLSGTIPQAIANLPSIHHLDLSHNRFSGLVPFSAVLVERLGPKLGLDGNDELCFEPETFGSFAERRMVVIGGCAVLLSSSLAERTSSSDGVTSENSYSVFHLVLSILAIFSSLH